MNGMHKYISHLSSIAGDRKAIEAEKKRLERIADELIKEIRAGITTATVPGLLWWLALNDIERTSKLVGIPVSNAAGHGRYLRALCASVPFSTHESNVDPHSEKLLERCEHLWDVIFFQEMIDDLICVDFEADERSRRNIASMTSLLEAVQGELVYVEQIEDRVERIFCPFSEDIIRPALGFTAEDAIRGFQKIREIVGDRLNYAHGRLDKAYELWEEFKQLADTEVTQEELDRFVYEHPAYDEVGKGLSDSFETFEQILLFRSTDLTEELGERSKAFLEAFSFVPGDTNLNYRFPHDDDAVRSRPFAKIDADSFLFVDVQYGSFSPPHRFRECFDTDRKLQRLNRRRDKSLEEEAVRLFCSVGDSELTLISYYIPFGQNGGHAERDLLILKNGTLFVVECKARPLRPVGARRDKLARIRDDVKRTIQEGYNQACDVIEYLKQGNKKVSFFDSNGPNANVLATIDSHDIREIIPIVFLDSYYGYIATDLAPWIQKHQRVGFPWVVDRDTFDSILLKIDSFEKLRSFLIWRRGLHGIVFNEDEAVFAGAFVQHGSFELPKKAGLVQLAQDYGDVFEAEYFRRKGFEVEIPPENLGPPVWASMQKDGDSIIHRVNGKIVERVNLQSGEVRKSSKSRRRRPTPGRIGRNDPCPCGSGRKYKKCCLNMQ